MMNEVFISNISNVDNEILKNRISELPEDRKLSISRFKKDSDKKRCFVAGMLLQYAFNKVFPYEHLPEACTNKNGKPYFKKISDFNFNISHSGDYVILAVSEKEIGCDIQKVENFEKKIISRIFSKNEQNYIFDGNENDMQDRFFRLWTLKESYLKFIGQGISGLNKLDLRISDDKIKIFYHNKICKCFCREFKVPDHKIAICGTDSILKISKMKPVQIDYEKTYLVTRQ